MKDLPSAQRVRLAVVLAVTTMLALASFWTVEIMRRTAEENVADRPLDEPDYYVEKFNFVRTSKTGQIQYHVSGERLVHNPEDDSYEVQNPIINSVVEEGPHMTTQARRAKVNSDRSKIHLFDNVVVERPASQSTEYFQLKSDYLLILPEADVMQTDKPVQIRFDRSLLNGTGMIANNATRQFELLSKAHVIYQPASKTVSR